MSGISPEREAAIFARFAEGATTRQVAAEFGIGTGTAARALQRYRDRQDPAQDASPASEPAEPDLTRITLTGVPGSGIAAELGELQRQRDVQAEAVDGLAANEAASRSAIEQLAAERVRAFDEGRVDVGLRDRAKVANDEAADWAMAAEMGRAKLARIDEQIRVVTVRQRLAADEAELGDATAAGTALANGGAAALRSFAEAVRAAATGLIAYRRDVAAAQTRAVGLHQAVNAARDELGLPQLPAPVLVVDALPPVPGPWAPGIHDAGHEALRRAWELAGVAAGGDPHRTGADSRTVAELAAVGDLFERLDAWEAERPEFERHARELAAQRQKALEREQRKAADGIGWQEPGTTDLDEYGNTLRPDPPEVRRDRSDAYPGTPPERAYIPFYRGF